MFVKILEKGRSDREIVHECRKYSAVTSDEKPFEMMFFIYHDEEEGRDVEQISVCKKTSEVFIENKEGKTVGSFRWKIDEGRNKAIRI